MKHLIATCNVQLGDNPNYFQDSNYIGYTLEIPVKITEIDQNSDLILIIIHTSSIETLLGDGHYVYINDHVIGRLKDEDGDEVEVIQIQKNLFKQLVQPNNFMLLKIRMDTWDRDGAGSGLLDDFIIKKIEIENAKPSTSISIP